MLTMPRVLLGGVLLMASETSAAHGGGLDAQGCHHDRKHGGYHCHRGIAARVPAPNFAPVSVPRQRLRGDDSDSTYYANCSAARAAGAAPVRRGDPGYARHLDRDGDGVGCE